MWDGMVLWRHILKQFSAFDLAAEFSKFSKTLIDNQKCKLAVAAKPLREVNFFCSFPLNEKFCGLSGLSCLSGLVPNYARRVAAGVEHSISYTVACDKWLLIKQ